MESADGPRASVGDELFERMDAAAALVEPAAAHDEHGDGKEAELRAAAEELVRVDRKDGQRRSAEEIAGRRAAADFEGAKRGEGKQRGARNGGFHADDHPVKEDDSG